MSFLVCVCSSQFLISSPRHIMFVNESNLAKARGNVPHFTVYDDNHYDRR